MNFDCRFAVAVMAAAMMSGLPSVRPVLAQAAPPAATAKSDAPVPQKGLATKAIEAAMTEAIVKAQAEGITDPDEIRARILAARDAGVKA